MTDDDYKIVYGLANERTRIAMDIAILTGLCQSDILALTRDSVTEDGLLANTQKTAKAILIEWSPELRELVARAKKLEPHVRLPLLCTREGRQYSASGFKANWQRLMAKAVEKGMERFTFHDLRAKSASDDELQVATERLGHTIAATTKRVYVQKPTGVKPLR